MKPLHVLGAVLLSGVALLFAACVTSESAKQIASDYYNIGNAFFDLGQYEKAVTYYQDALRADPGMVKADYNLALTLVRMKRIDEAVVILKRLRPSEPEPVLVPPDSPGPPSRVIVGTVESTCDRDARSRRGR